MFTEFPVTIPVQIRHYMAVFSIMLSFIKSNFSVDQCSKYPIYFYVDRKSTFPV